MAPTAQNPPPLNIPPSNSIANVSIINTTSRVKGIPNKMFMLPEYKGFDYLDCPAFSFLIEHPPSGRKLLFDLGVRKDWEKEPAAIAKRIKKAGWSVTVEKGVAEILREGGVDPKEIDSLIWSHHHWDHTGDPSTFPPTTTLIVGPGFKSAFLPGYPTNPDAPISESAYTNRTLREISFSQDTPNTLTLGRCPAFDFFGDGSFYLLDTPGHAIGHMAALCRTTPSSNEGEEATFMFLGGDCAHHGAEIRPTPYLPLPSFLTPSPLPHIHSTACPGALFADAHKRKQGEEAYTTPFVEVNAEAAHDGEQARGTVRKLGEFDGWENVLTVLAHDDTLVDVVGFFPESRANGWKKEGWRERGLWRFLGDLSGAVEAEA